MKSNDFTVLTGVWITGRCRDCAAEMRGELALRLVIVENVPGFEFAVAQRIADRTIGHIIGKVPFSKLGGVNLQKMPIPPMQPGKN